MNTGDFPPPLKDFLLWAGGLVGLATTMLGLRARKSKDDTQHAKDVAEASIYRGALADMTIDKDNGWRVARENESLLRQASADVARLTAMHEAQQTEIRRLQQQVKSLQLMVGRIADPEFRKKLGPDFSASQTGALDDEPTIPFASREP